MKSMRMVFNLSALQQGSSCYTAPQMPLSKVLLTRMAGRWKVNLRMVLKAQPSHLSEFKMFHIKLFYFDIVRRWTHRKSHKQQRWLSPDKCNGRQHWRQVGLWAPGVLKFSTWVMLTLVFALKFLVKLYISFVHFAICVTFQKKVLSITSF